MCHFITLIVPPTDPERLNQILQAHGRVAATIRNPSLAALLDSGDLQFRTARTCDCGTVLAPAQPEDEAARGAAAEIVKLRKRGWSEAKIERSLANREHAQATARKPSVDSLAMWTAVIQAMLAEPNVTHLGLFLHFYAGDIESEELG